MGEGEFYSPVNLQEACELLAKYGKKATVLAGGTDVMVLVNRRQLSPEVLVYIGDCGLNYVKVEGANLVIGAGTPHGEIAGSKLVKVHAPLLAHVAGTIGSPAIRNVGTIGGNLANASPAADSAVALLALGASVKLASAKAANGSGTLGERTVPLADFFVGPGETVKRPEELLKEVIIPVPGTEVKWAFRKIGKRRADVCPTISMAVAVLMDDGKCLDARIALGSVAPTPLLAKQANALLAGKKVDVALIAEVAKAVAGETNAIDDVRGQAWYRRRAAEALAKDLLGRVAGAAKGSGTA